MCVIVYKPKDVAIPKREELEDCFFANPDGAGYMFPTEDGVEIKKGYMTFDNFYENLMKDYKSNENKPFVLHFRIGTQGGNIPQNTHPFPVSDEVEDLRALHIYTEVGVAHNGIISLTSSYYDYNTKTSDTMDFITGYLSLIASDSSWYKKKGCKKSKALIEKLIGSYNKLAIMSADGHVELIGEFEKDGDCYYSNLNHKHTYVYTDSKGKEKTPDDKLDWYNYDDIDEYYNQFLREDGYFDFDEDSCPYELEGDQFWCTQCVNYPKCWLGAEEGVDFNKDDCVSGKKCSGCPYRNNCRSSMFEETVTPLENQMSIEGEKTNGKKN